MIEKEENTKISKNKKRNLIIIIVILLILFGGYGISIKSTPESREKEIISYLEKKYNSKFKIIEMTSSGEHIILPEISCDGSTFCPEIKNKGVYYYRYNVLSLSDNVTFEVEYLDKRLEEDKITEKTTYFSIINEDNIRNDITNYAISILGKENTVIGASTIKIDKNFDKVCDNNYIKKLEKITQYIDEKNSLDPDMDLSLYLEYLDGISVTLGSKKPIIIKRSAEKFDGAEGIDITTGEYMKTYYSIEEYWER